MSQMSCRATRLMLEAAELRGIDLDALLAGATYTRDELFDVRRKIGWGDFVDFTARLERAVGGATGELEALGATIMGAPSYGFFRTAARYALSTRQLHEIGSRFVAPVLAPELQIEIVEADDRRLVIRAVVPDKLPMSVSFFRICAGAFGALSTLLGLPPSTVGLSISGQVGLFEIALPREPRSVRTLFRRLRARAFGVPMHELWEQQDAAHESYQEMLRSRQELRDLLDRAPIGAAIHRDGKYLWVNAALAEMAGWDNAAQFVGRPLLEDVHPEDRERVVDRLARPAAATARGEYRILRRDGTTGVWEVAASQIVMFNGAPARLLLGSDVTERVRTREQLALNDRMASLGMLAAGVAHEINNPLTYVQLNVQAIARELERIDVREPIREAAATAVEGLERVRTIVADLRTFARSDEDMVAPVDVNDVIRTTIRLAERTIAASSRIEVALEEIPPVAGNRGQLGQVVLNLLVNAHEAVQERGLPGHIRVRSMRESGGQVLVEIADNGIGISSEALPHVFEPFFTRKPLRRGTGLGLAICHRIVSRYEGGITIESTRATDGDPSLRTFARIRLKAGDSPLGQTPPGSVHPPALLRRRILVVDDEPSVGQAIESALGPMHDVVVVAEGREALALLEADPTFDVVLCDVMMPGLDGIQLYEEAVRRAPALESRFVFMSGGAFSPRARAFLASSTNPRLEKPFNLVQLTKVIERAVRGE